MGAARVMVNPHDQQFARMAFVVDAKRRNAAAAQLALPLAAAVQFDVLIAK
jgi:mannose/fructose/N-acetylgalactosamine-specific phosphotransferase system component IIC